MVKRYNIRASAARNMHVLEEYECAAVGIVPLMTYVREKLKFSHLTDGYVGFAMNVDPDSDKYAV